MQLGPAAAHSSSPEACGHFNECVENGSCTCWWPHRAVRAMTKKTAPRERAAAPASKHSCRSRRSAPFAPLAKFRAATHPPVHAGNECGRSPRRMAGRRPRATRGRARSGSGRGRRSARWRGSVGSVRARVLRRGGGLFAMLHRADRCSAERTPECSINTWAACKPQNSQAASRSAPKRVGCAWCTHNGGVIRTAGVRFACADVGELIAGELDGRGAHEALRIRVEGRV